MKHLLLFCFTLLSIGIHAQLNTTLVGNLDYPETVNDVWGYVAPDGTEYAIVGTRQRTSVVSLADPSNPTIVYEAPGTQSIWRDMKSHGDYIYAVADQGRDGLLIIDLTRDLRRCHNLYIDDGFIYLSGCNLYNQGVIILDINEDPLNPKVVSSANLQYSHDVFVRDTLMFASEINRGQLGIYSIADKQRPQLLTTQITSLTFTHNAWSSDDNNYIFTTDERSNAFLDAYDISDLDQIEKIDRYRVLATEGNGVIPHNTHWHNGYLVTSWYTEGVVIIDANKPDNLVRVAQYDTWDGAHGGFNGCWGAYPFLPSGLVLGSDGATGLYVLDVDYKRAAYLEGTVYDELTGDPLNTAQIEILSDDPNYGLSDPVGVYRTGQITEGTFKAVATRKGYFSDTIEVQLTNGEVFEGDFYLDAKQRVNLDIQVFDRATGEQIPNAEILVDNEGEEKYELADSDGGLLMSTLGGNISVIVGKQGYISQEVKKDFRESETVEIYLERGIADDFSFDYGWVSEGTAETGAWNRAIPTGTNLNGARSNPDVDSPDDIGKYAFVTGKPATTVGAEDVDGGEAVLKSPFFDISGIRDPHVQFSLWFYNGGGANDTDDPNDYLRVLITDGLRSAALENVTDLTRSSGSWSKVLRHNIFDNIGAADQVQIVVYVADIEPGHLVEAGFDNFAIVSGTSVATAEEALGEEITIAPNPFNTSFEIRSEEPIKGYTLYDIIGKEIMSAQVNRRVFTVNVPEMGKGLFLVSMEMENGDVAIKKVVRE